MTDKYGMFSPGLYLKPGAPPEAATRRKSQDMEAGPIDRDHGLNMKATAPRTGKLNDATFGKLLPLSVGDKYVDPLKAKLQYDAEKRKRNITEKPFKTAHCIPKNATPGDFYGTSGKVPYMPAYVEVKKVKGDIQGEPRGIYTSPAKKGSYGINKLTLSQRVGAKGVATEYEYQHEPSSLQDAQRRAARDADHKARVTDAPFKPAAPPKKGGFGVPNTTISKGKGVAGEWEYLIVARPESGSSKSGKADLVPFRPTHAMAFKRMEKIPYIHDPEVPKLMAESQKRLAESKFLESKGSWRPSAGPKTDMVRSVVKMNIQ